MSEDCAAEAQETTSTKTLKTTHQAHPEAWGFKHQRLKQEQQPLLQRISAAHCAVDSNSALAPFVTPVVARGLRQNGHLQGGAP